MAYYVRKVAGFLVTLFLVSLLTFLVFQILPGDPARVILGVDADPLQLQQLREELGMDRPAPLRFLEWLGGVLRGDLGTSYRYHQPVSALLGSALGVTAQLAVYALVLTAAVGCLWAFGWPTTAKRNTPCRCPCSPSWGCRCPPSVWAYCWSASFPWGWGGSPLWGIRLFPKTPWPV